MTPPHPDETPDSSDEPGLDQPEGAPEPAAVEDPDAEPEREEVTPPSATPVERPWNSVRWWTQSRVGMASLVIAALSLVVALLAFVNDRGLLPGAGDAGAPPTTATAAPPAARLFDDFSGADIDPAKWTVEDPSGYFAVVDGTLQAQVRRASSEQTAGTLTAYAGEDIREVDFDVRLVDGTGPSEGGLYVILVGQNGEQRRVVFGPGNTLTAPQGFAVESCADPSCDAVEYVADGTLTVGRSYAVALSVESDAVVIDVPDSRSPVRVDAMTPIREVRFYATTNVGASLRVQVDNVRFRE